MPRDLHFGRPPHHDRPYRARRLIRPSAPARPARRERPDDAPRPESRDDVTPTSALLFLAAAIAFQQSILAGGSSAPFIVGAVCLAVSVGAPLVARLRAWSRRRDRLRP